MATLGVYPFRFRDPRTGKWVSARDKLQVLALQRRYGESEITGAPEIRHVTPGPIEHFNPFRAPEPAGVGEIIVRRHHAAASVERRCISTFGKTNQGAHLPFQIRRLS